MIGHCLSPLFYRMRYALFALLLFMHTGSASALSDNPFENISLYDFSLKVSEQTGYTLLFSPKVRLERKVEVYSSEEIAADDLYNIFLSVLRVHGYVGVRQGDIVRIVLERKARYYPVPVVTDS